MISLKSKYKITLVFVILLITAVTLLGCRPQQRPAPPDTNDDGIPDTRYDNMQPNEDMDMGMNEYPTDRADRIADAVENIQGVDRASVVITGDTALVGVDIDNNLAENTVNDFTKTIRRTVANVDNRIDTVLVTTDTGLYERIDNMAEDLRRGRPISYYGNEIREIMQQMTPTR